MIFLEGIALGFANTLFCVGACLPALLPVVLGQKGKSSCTIIKFMSGRLTAYIFFAVLSAMTGIYFEGRVNPRIFSVFMIFFSLCMLIFATSGLKLSFCPSKLTIFVGKNIPVYAGFVMGINICPPFLLSLSRTLELGNVLLSVIFFMGFYLGSSAWLIILLFPDKLPKSKYVNSAGRILAAAVGIWYMLQALLILLY